MGESDHFPTESWAGLVSQYGMKPGPAMALAVAVSDLIGLEKKDLQDQVEALTGHVRDLQKKIESHFMEPHTLEASQMVRKLQEIVELHEDHCLHRVVVGKDTPIICKPPPEPATPQRDQGSEVMHLFDGKTTMRRGTYLTIMNAAMHTDGRFTSEDIVALVPYQRSTVSRALVHGASEGLLHRLTKRHFLARKDRVDDLMANGATLRVDQEAVMKAIRSFDGLSFTPATLLQKMQLSGVSVTRSIRHHLDKLVLEGAVVKLGTGLYTQARPPLPSTDNPPEISTILREKGPMTRQEILNAGIALGDYFDAILGHRIVKHSGRGAGTRYYFPGETPNKCPRCKTGLATTESPYCSDCDSKFRAVRDAKAALAKAQQEFGEAI